VVTSRSTHGTRPTMADVARSAGVAVSTVSRVVNADPTVGRAFVDRVNEAITTLGWEADDRARHLRLGVSGTIGAVVVELDSPFLRAAERAARAAGLMVLTMATENDEHLEVEAVRSLSRRRVDGLIIEQGTGIPNPHLAELLSRGLPVVAMDRPLPGMAADAVISDNARGIELAYDHLVGRGHRVIVFVGDDERLFTGAERADAFRRSADEHGHRAARRVFTGPVSGERVAADLDRALARRPRPTALVTGNAGITTLAFRHLGMALGGLDFVGFDDLELATVLDPPTTVVAQDYAEMGRETLRLLRTRLEDPALPIRRSVVPVHLVDRSAGGRDTFDLDSVDRTSGGRTTFDLDNGDRTTVDRATGGRTAFDRNGARARAATAS